VLRSAAALPGSRLLEKKHRLETQLADQISAVTSSKQSNENDLYPEASVANASVEEKSLSAKKQEVLRVQLRAYEESMAEAAQVQVTWVDRQMNHVNTMLVHHLDELDKLLCLVEAQDSFGTQKPMVVLTEQCLDRILHVVGNLHQLDGFTARHEHLLRKLKTLTIDQSPYDPVLIDIFCLTWYLSRLCA